MNQALLDQVDAAAAAGKLSAGAVKNIRIWLTESRYAEYTDQIAQHIAEEMWQALDDAFWTIIPFGTGGRRGRMYPIGSNGINDRTIGESAQGLASYVKEALTKEAADKNLGDLKEFSCAIAYDTRHQSNHFAKLCAEIMVANGYKVYFLAEHRSTPELSFAVRYKSCSCGIMVTASHNPPSDNAVKVYWNTGGQILPPHDSAVIERVMSVDTILRTPYEEAVAAGQIEICQTEIDQAFIEAVATQITPGPRDLKIVYSPLHGVGTTAIVPALQRAGFKELEIFGPHAKPDGDFPNVPGHVSNPENPAVFDAISEYCKTQGSDLALASDPDCDRIGLSAPLTPDEGSPWATLTGNQIGVLLADYRLETWQAAGKLTAESYVVKTLVTTDMIRQVTESYGAKTFGDLLVGFKWIAGVIDQQGPENFVFGTEESHGYLTGTYARDKDGAVAALLTCELAAKLKAAGQTLHQKLESLSWQHGLYVERTISVQMPGSEGMSRMKEVMASFRSNPPSEVGGIQVAQVSDYLSQTVTLPAAAPTPLDGPQGDLVMLDLADSGNRIAVRPSGTEPKIKFYMFAHTPAEQLSLLEMNRNELNERLDAFEKSLRTFAGL